MNRGLWLALLASSAAAVAVSALPDPATESVAAVSRQTVSEPAGVSGRVPTRVSPPALADIAVPPSAPAPASAHSVAAPTRAPWPEIDPAASRAWAAAPPPQRLAVPAVPAAQAVQAVQAAASAPAAPPPFPYVWIGQMEIEGRVQIYLSSPQRLAVAYEGDVLDTRWRIDSVRTGRLQVTWLPTDTAVAVAAR